MPEIVQVSLPGYNASLKQCDIDDLESATIQQLLDQLLDEHGRHIASEVECDIDQDSGLTLDDVAANRQLWGIQRIVMSSPNRRWSDDELLALPANTGRLKVSFVWLCCADSRYSLAEVLNGQTRLSSVVSCATSSGRTKDRPDLPARQFSDFALTQHLSIPLIRIVYIPLALNVIFSHIPEFPEDFQLVYYVSGNSTVEEVIECLLDELGIRKLVTEGAKKERVEYSLALGDNGLLSLLALGKSHVADKSIISAANVQSPDSTPDNEHCGRTTLHRQLLDFPNLVRTNRHGCSKLFKGVTKTKYRQQSKPNEGIAYRYFDSQHWYSIRQYLETGKHMGQSLE